MRNPWLDIPLDDYEGHMSLPSVGQSGMLGDQFERLIQQHSPASVAIMGCAGGNGLDRIVPGGPQRIVAVDINPRYIMETGDRYARRLPGLELYCGDIQSESLNFAPVDFAYAALILEYVDLPSSLATLRRNLRVGGALAVLLQLPHAALAPVSSSRYASLGALAPALELVPPARLRETAAATGFGAQTSGTIRLPSGKEFWLGTFRALTASPVID